MTVKEFNTCVDNYADSLYRFVLKNIKNEEKAKDVVQESFTKLWDKKNDVDSTKVKSYLFTTAYHTLIDVIRKDKRSKLIDDYSQYEQTHSNYYTDLQEVLHEAIDKLPNQQKAVILLRDYEGYSYEEIAEITQLSLSQVKVYIFRARKFLKNYLVSLETII